MVFSYMEKVGFNHSIEVDTKDEELFEEITEDIAEEMYAGCDDGTDMSLRKFKDAFGEANVKFIKDTSGTVVEYEAVKLTKLTYSPGGNNVAEEKSIPGIRHSPAAGPERRDT